MTEDGSLAKIPRGACQRCRMRKLRCDVLGKGIPCSNCVLKGNECIYLPSKRRSKYRPPLSPPQPQPKASGVCYLNNSISSSIPLSTKLLGSSKECRKEDWNIEGIEYVIPQWDLRFLQSIPSRYHATPNKPHSLPSYIKPLPASMDSDDLTHLISHNVFDFPPFEVVREVLRGYVRWFHPICPVIDICECLDAFFKPGDRKGISLLLFYAIFFSGSAYVEGTFLARLGFDSRIAARQALFKRTKLLYDLGIETDKIVTSQAAIIMSNWYENDDSPDDTWYWASAGFHIAESLSLDSFDYNDTSGSGRLEQTRKLFWCAFCRLALSSLGMRRCLNRSIGTFKFPQLLRGDFIDEPLPSHSLEALGNCSFLGNIDYLRQSASVFFSQVALCLRLTEILDSLFTGPSRGLETHAGQTMKLRPIGTQTETVDMLDNHLHNWLESLPLWLGQKLLAPLQDQDYENEPVLLMNITFLKLLFLGVVIVLHRPRAQCMSIQDWDDAVDSISLSRYKADTAANELQDAVEKLQAHNIMTFLPLSGITAILNGAIYSMQRTLAEDELPRVLLGVNVHSLSKALFSLSSIQPAAKNAVIVLECGLKSGRFEWCRHYVCSARGIEEN